MKNNKRLYEEKMTGDKIKTLSRDRYLIDQEHFLVDAVQYRMNAYFRKVDNCLYYT